MLNPVYDWTDRTGQRLLGYEVNQQVAVKVRDLDIIGEAIAKTSAKGANQIGGVSFTIDDEEELKAEARDKAIELAKQKAEDIAKKTGMKLGEVVNVYENNYYAPRAISYAKMDMAEGIGYGGGEMISAPSIEAGENEVSVEVNVVYKVR